MTASQRVLFTALPNGPVADVPNRFALSVHVSPRLTETQGDTTLSHFPDWVDWPKKLNAIGWSVVFGNDAPRPATVVSAPARSDFWMALFGDALVRSHAPTYYDARPIRSYPARNIREFLRDRYTKVAVSSPTEFPHIDDLLTNGFFGPLSSPDLVLANTSTTGAAIEGDLGDPAKRAIVNGLPLQNPLKDFYQLRRFHRPRLPSDPDTVPPVAKPVLDFHEAVSTVGQWPPLLRLLGLVVDLVVDTGPSVPASPTEVQVVPAWTPVMSQGSAVAPIRTRCVISSSSFQARPRPVSPPELVNGRIPLNDTDRFTVLQEDQDGGGLKAVDFAQNLNRFRTGSRSSGSPARYALPSLRSGGLSVARINRAPQFHERMSLATDLSKAASADVPAPVVVDAEDITRGYRIDIRDTRDGTWFPLCARIGSYRFLKTEVPFKDEGWVTAAPTEDAAKDIYLQETLFRWGGWSLAAPRPGARLATTQGGDPLTTAPNTPGPDFPVLITVKAAPGSLPRLRFGRSYQVRARAVDLAGNSVPLDPKNRDVLASPPVDYGRFEPVPTPLVLPFAPRTEGESLERVVLRSNYNEAPPPVEVARHIVPPKAEQLLAEHHGLFDTPTPNSAVNPAAYSTISKYLLPNPPDPDAPVVQSEQGTFANSSERKHDPEDHEKTFYYPKPLVTLPYLPDPIARGASLLFLDEPWAGFRLPAQFRAEDAWPVHKPVRLVIRERPARTVANPEYDAETHQISVPLAKGEVVRVRLSAYLDPGDLQKLALWKWIVEGGGEGLRQEVVEGRHWMVTPYRTLTLVHAVRQPLRMAEFIDFGVQLRKIGETFVHFHGQMSFSRKSTSKIDVLSEWGEFVDEGLDPMSPRPRRAVVFTVPGDRGTGDVVPVGPDNPEDRQEFGDTKHRNVTYRTVATTSFSEYFLARHTVAVEYLNADTLEVLLPTGGKGVVPGSVAVKNKVAVEKGTGKVLPPGAGTYQAPNDFEVDAPTGKVTLKKGRVPDHATVVITFLVPPIVRPGPGEAMTPVALNIKSTAPPAVPKVLYVVPTFGWEKKTGPQPGTFSSKRAGNGLRVYLDRPWWSTGEGELLGVVVAGVDALPALVEAQPVTRWGVDPVFGSNLPPATRPAVNHFPAAVKNGQGLPVAGGPGLVDVAGHAVGFDAGRKLWYCDIEVASASYFPFIRLTLARFQPDSIDGAHLSPVVVAEFSQLAPDRSASVVFGPVVSGGGGNASGQRTATITVTGFTHSRAAGQDGVTTVRAALEERDPDVPNDLGWSRVGNDFLLTAQAGPDNFTVWTGKGTVPKAKPGSPQRIVLEEYERHRTGLGNAVGERIVYTDVINI